VPMILNCMTDDKTIILVRIVELLLTPSLSESRTKVAVERT
jgi:hypothetical protein